jgi:tetratricopeptide (TPR) repeat protein
MSVSLLHPLLGGALLAALACAQGEAPAPAAAQEPAAVVVKNPFQPFDRARFEAAAKQLGANEAQLQTFATQIAELGLTRAADNLLRAAVPAFDAAVKRHEASDPAAALELTKVLAAATDPLLQAHVRYHLARVFIDSDDPEKAIQILNEYLKDNINRSPLDAEAAFFYAQSLAEIPRVDDAIPRFRAFLQWFPEASERFRSAAHQQVRELERQRESRLHQLADGMKKTTRDLKKQKTDKPVQLDQEKYIEELDQLIEMYEEMEKKSGGPPSGNGPSSNPATQSALPDGDGSVGELQKRPSLADRWGDMKDRDREKIEAAVQKGLPPQYQKMLEEYYKKLGKAQGK